MYRYFFSCDGLTCFDFYRYLDKEGFAAIGRITEGAQYLDSIFDGYGEGGRGDGSDGKGPGQGRAANKGNDYLDSLFPKLARILDITVWQT
jgi:hypothetical protein